MIPTIETIVCDLVEGKITKCQAIDWLHKHAEDAYRTLRDDFASAALNGWLSGPCQGEVLDDYHDDMCAFVEHQQKVAETCYTYADAMLAERNKP